jgi:VanZ family protein
MPGQNRPILPRYLLTAYTLLVVYASLHPLSGWRDQGVPLGAFQLAPLPRYFTWFDVLANVGAYLPLGFLAAVTLNERPRSATAIAVAGCFALSLALESLQVYLPSRIPSNVDLACNTFGAALGAALGMRTAPRLLDRRMRALREHWLVPGAHMDLGLVLLGMWLLSQANPALLLFGNGDLRAALELSRTPFSADVFRLMEAAIVALNLTVAGCIAALIARDRPHARVIVPCMLLLTLVAKALASALLFRPENFLAWLTPGAQAGLGAGAAILAAALTLRLPRPVLAAIAVAFAFAAVLIVNLVPENPYHTSALPLWQQGQFLNFNGLTGVIALAWPFAAAAWSSAAIRR